MTDQGPEGRGAGRVVMIVIGSLLALIGAAIALGGAGILIANGVLRDDEGFFNTARHTYETPTAALLTDGLDVTTTGPGDAWSTTGFATVRIDAADREGDTPVFVGIGPTAAVAEYLGSAARDEIADIEYDPFVARYRRQGGPIAAVDPPGSEAFWVARASGDGRQEVRWPVESGDWSVVVMNADGSPGVAVEARAGAKLRYLVQIGVGLLAGGLLLLGGAVALIVAGSRRRADPPDAGALAIGGSGAAALASAENATAAALTTGERVAPYPATLEGRLDEPLSRWLWLVKWLLLIPHVIVLAVLWLAFIVTTIVAGFAILFTGRYPRGIFDFNVGVLRWTWRVAFYGYNANGTDRYPPFSLGPEPGYPATLEVPYPERLSRGLVLVKWWLLAIPHYVIVAFFGGWSSWGGLIAVVVLISMIYLLFTGRPFRDLWDFVIGMNRWTFRTVVYAALMRDEYPPFRLAP